MQGGEGVIRRVLPSGSSSADAAAAQRAAASRMAMPRQTAAQASSAPVPVSRAASSSVLYAAMSSSIRPSLVATAAAAPASSIAALRLVAGRLGAVGTRPPAGQLPGVALRAGGTDSRIKTASASEASAAGVPKNASLREGAAGSEAPSFLSSTVVNGTGIAGQGICPNGFVKKERLRFTLSDLAVSTTVGTGTFGRVCVAQHIDSSRWYALKILKKSEVRAYECVTNVRNA